MQADIVIVGAGAAGVACAAELNLAGRDYMILEARDRVGGRILSEWDLESQQPLELGAEFVHGAPDILIDALTRLHLPFFDVKDEHLWLEKRKLVEIKDFFERVEKLLGRLKKDRKQDRTLEEAFLSIENSRDRALTRSFVEGFQAADLSKAGECGLADEMDGEEKKLNGSHAFRINGAYDRVVKEYTELKGLQLNAILRRVEWSSGDVRLHVERGGSEEIVRCKQVVFTLPVGVWRSGSVAWDPIPKDWAVRIEALEMGHVQRLVFKFRSRFWESHSEKPASYFHAGPETYFPTWWTLSPMRTPHLVAWQGGPKAKEMAAWSEADRVEKALETLAKLFNRSRAKIREELVSWHAHDWSNDPFACGAYSYIALDGLPGAKRWPRPIDDTLYFAGEATAATIDRGTVHGALLSGQRAARQLLKT